MQDNHVKKQQSYFLRNLFKSLTLGHLQTSLHDTHLIAILDKSLTLGHLQTSLHDTHLIAIFFPSVI